MAISKPTVGATGWNTAVDAVIDRVNELEGFDPEDAVLSVNGVTAGANGAVSVDKVNIGLGSVDNTADTAKPVSTFQQTALNAKANTSHTHAEGDVTGLTTALSGKSATTHNHSGVYEASGNVGIGISAHVAAGEHPIVNITGLQAIIDDLTGRIVILEGGAG